MKQGEPKGAGFLLQNLIPIYNPEQTTVRSGEARQDSQVGGDFNFKRLKQFAIKMKNNPTPAEKFLREYLKIKNIPYKTQYVIYPYIVDFVFLQKGLVIELDGNPHSENINQMSYDTKRDELLMSLKLRVIRFNNEDILKNPQQIIDIYNQKPTKNWGKNNIAKHNFHYHQRGFYQFSPRRFQILLKRNLKRELNIILKSYKQRILCKSMQNL